MFTLDNTQGFSQDSLDLMNEKLAFRISECNYDSDDCEQILKEEQRKIFDQFC